VLIASQKFHTENILMASQLASGDLVSDRYASALYDLAAEKKLVDPF
jgi:hypothetical protein